MRAYRPNHYEDDELIVEESFVITTKNSNSGKQNAKNKGQKINFSSSNPNLSDDEVIEEHKIPLVVGPGGSNAHVSMGGQNYFGQINIYADELVEDVEFQPTVLVSAGNKAKFNRSKANPYENTGSKTHRGGKRYDEYAPRQNQSYPMQNQNYNQMKQKEYMPPNQKHNKFTIDRPLSTPISDYNINTNFNDAYIPQSNTRSKVHHSSDNLKAASIEIHKKDVKKKTNATRDEMRATLADYYKFQLGNSNTSEIIEDDPLREEEEEEHKLADYLTPEEKKYLEVEPPKDNYFLNEKTNKNKSTYGIEAEVPVYDKSTKLDVKILHNHGKYENYQGKKPEEPVGKEQAKPMDIVVGKLPEINSESDSNETNISMIARSLGVKIKTKSDTITGRREAADISLKDLVTEKLVDAPQKTVGNLRVRLNKNANVKDLLPRIKVDPIYENGPIPKPVQEPKPAKEISRYLLGRTPEFVEDDYNSLYEPELDPNFDDDYAPLNEGGRPIELTLGDFAGSLAPTRPIFDGTDPTKKPIYKYTAAGRAQLETQRQKEAEELKSKNILSKVNDDEEVLEEVVEIIKKKRRQMTTGEMINSAIISGIVFVILLIIFKSITK